MFYASLLKGRDCDGFPQYQEKFIRECIRKFPYCEATLLQQLVRSIAPVEIVSKLPDNRLMLHGSVLSVETLAVHPLLQFVCVLFVCYVKVATFCPIINQRFFCF